MKPSFITASRYHLLSSSIICTTVKSLRNSPVPAKYVSGVIAGLLGVNLSLILSLSSREIVSYCGIT